MRYVGAFSAENRKADEQLRRARRDHGLRARHQRKIMSSYQAHMDAAKAMLDTTAIPRTNEVEARAMSVIAATCIAVASLAPSFLAAFERIGVELAKIHDDRHDRMVDHG